VKKIQDILGGKQIINMISIVFFITFFIFFIINWIINLFVQQVFMSFIFLIYVISAGFVFYKV